MNNIEDPGSAARALAAVPFFAALTPVDLAKLAGVLEDRWIDAGTVVFESGGAGDALYILREGTAERRVAGSTIGLIHPLAVFGELALLTDEPRSASIVAVTPLRVWVLPRNRFDALLRGEPELMFHLSATIGLQLAKTRRALGALRRELEREGKKLDAGEAELASSAEPPAILLAPTAADAPPHAKLSLRWILTIAIALTPFLFWTTTPPAGLSPAAWQALLSIISAAILFASEALPEAVVALALLAVWVVGGITAPRVALDGFATQAWVLVLAVLAVGVAVGNTGLLYRVGLVALGRKPAGWFSRCLTLALVGVAVTPTLPNATSRMALAAPMVREVAEALGYEPGERAATGLALAALIGFGQMAGLFLTGSSVGLLVHGLLPSETRTDFGFLGWFIAALPLHLVLFAATLLAISALYKPAEAAVSAGDRLALQRAVLGPMRREEKICLLVLLGMIAGFVSEPLHGVNGAWIGVAALVALAATGALDTTMLRTGVNWPFLVFFGVITSLASVFDTLDIDAWFAARLTEPIREFAASGLVFCLALAIAGFALAFLVRWQAAAPLLTLIALPAASAAAVHPFLVALISLVSTQVWFLPYQSTVYLALYHGSSELFTHRDARPLAWLWGVLVLVSIAAAYPAWRAMRLIG
jgi:di/tricarboxylate transporter/CRP-like cAMP-binding protein